MAKSVKQTTSEDYVKQMEKAEKIVTDIIDEIRADTDNFDIVDDNIGHLMTHAQNIAGEFRVIKGQYQSFADREQAIADAIVAKAAADKAAAAAAAKAKADAAKAASDDA